MLTPQCVQQSAIWQAICILEAGNVAVRGALEADWNSVDKIRWCGENELLI